MKHNVWKSINLNLINQTKTSVLKSTGPYRLLDYKFFDGPFNKDMNVFLLGYQSIQTS